eukprot:TRINITY_DN4372_c0_g1_i7.p1 TRINITY_DN4372_c0_g1~~TRINITY_DN4372_c0_g1_i7.p1  ORF type:complete len:229 (+),score=67.11 TRINITY_DN4372_c0_g1_i7:903-1589(+)
MSDFGSVYLAKCQEFSVDPIKSVLVLAEKRRQQLTSLDASNKCLADRQLVPLVAALLPNYTLVCLDLSGNQLACNAAHLLSGRLLREPHSPLRRLLLSRNRIGDRGAAYLADALAVNNSLEDLALEANEIGDAGLAALADALRRNQRLVQVRLDGNVLTAAGADAVLASIQRRLVRPPSPRAAAAALRCSAQSHADAACRTRLKEASLPLHPKRRRAGLQLKFSEHHA